MQSGARDGSSNIIYYMYAYANYTVAHSMTTRYAHRYQLTMS
jgi:hypothetical protein